MKNFLLALCFISIFFCGIVPPIAFNLQGSHYPTINYTMLSWCSGLQTLAIIISIVLVSGYFNQDIWKSKSEMDDAKLFYSQQSEKLSKWLKILGRHEAIKTLKEAGIKEEDME